MGSIGMWLSIAAIGVPLIVGIYLDYKGSRVARAFLWAWAILIAAAAYVIVVNDSYVYPVVFVAAVTVAVVVYYISRKWETHDVTLAKAETKRILAEMNARVDSERKFLAGRLHDDVNHKLLEAKMCLKQLLALLEKDMSDPRINDAARMLVVSVQDLVFDTYKECREIIKNTRVEIIESIGLIAALEDMFTQYKAVMTKPRMVFDHNLNEGNAPKGDVAITLYRIIQEAILNVVKHANANIVTVKLYYRKKTQEYELEVKDDGVGIARDKKPTGVGMIDMRERAASLGSDFQLVSVPDRGCRIRLKFKRADLVLIERRKGPRFDRRKNQHSAPGNADSVSSQTTSHSE